MLQTKKSLVMSTLMALCMMLLGNMAVQAQAIHVATDGNDDNAGTAEAPLKTIHKAVERVQPGDTVWVHGGTYVISERIKIPQKPTTADRRCYLWAVPGEQVIIDGSAMHHTTEGDFKMGRCIYVNHLANYWHFKGLTLCNAEDNGMKVEGSYNIIELCVFHDNNDTGLQIGMYKDFDIEETKELPKGTPQYNPGYQFCRGNIVINCDAYNNNDSREFDGKDDDGGDADGFACKLFPGPGTEFHGCRAWNNSDDNWDLYMVYHPVVIDSCWAYHAGYFPDGRVGKNGNGFKLGGGGSAGGAAFDQSLGAHVLTNCVSFGNLHKGYDQNNAYEGMYIINCTAWGNEFNYRFPTIFKYGGMMIRNCIGWGATVENHEFLSGDKEGVQVPNTDYNSWTTLDQCSPYKESTKVGKAPNLTKDYSGEFVSLSVADFMAPRQADGSLPDNGFARLKAGSVMKDKGTPIVGFTPERHLPLAEATAAHLELITADDITIPYNDAAPDFGAYELDGVPADITVPEKATLTCLTANAIQEVMRGEPIADIVFEMGGAASGATVAGLAEGLTYTIDGALITISGTPAESCTYVVTVTGGPREVTTTGIITCVTPYRVLTGDWYPFQDLESALPADLQGVLSTVTGDDAHPSRIDPAYKESDGNVPAGCTLGALVMGRNNGGARWDFTDGVLQLLVNLHITGGRTFKINYTLADGTQHTANVAKMSKGTYCAWDVLAQAGIDEAAAQRIRSISLLNNNSGGEVRLYDMYVRVPVASAPTAISNLPSDGNTCGKARKYLLDGRIVIERAGQRYNAVGERLY